MTIELSSDGLNRIQKAVSAQRAQSPVISVREAAERLGVSRSRVYRMDRVNGPFRFIIEGRRIYIDRASFESHLGNIERIRAGSCPPDVENVPPCQWPTEETLKRSQLDEPQVNTQAPDTPSASLPASSSGGQRELPMPPYRPPFVVFFYS